MTVLLRFTENAFLFTIKIGPLRFVLQRCIHYLYPYTILRIIKNSDILISLGNTVNNWKTNATTMSKSFI